MSKFLLVGNWKMNLDRRRSRDLAKAVLDNVHTLVRTEIWLAPPAINIPVVSDVLLESSVKVGAQNVHWEMSGAYTGELSPEMLKDYGCTFAIVGHSERRHIFGESNELVVKRANGALTHGITPIFCVGESAAERSEGKTVSVLKAQLFPFLNILSAQNAARVVIAYEPVWAIGTGKVASIEQIQEAHRAILDLWSSHIGSNSLRILYGGSATPENCESIIALPEVSGALVGGASLKSELFLALAAITERVLLSVDKK